MKELLIRSISGLVLAALLLACILVSPWTFASLLLLVVAIGTFEMSRLQQMNSISHLVCGLFYTIVSFVLAALVALDCIDQKWLLLELVFVFLPFIYALFTKSKDLKQILAFVYGSLFFLSLPSALMVFIYGLDLFGFKTGQWLVILIFCLLWVNDIFAYLTGKLLGKHKLFPRVSPGKTIEGSIGGLVFTMISMAVFSYYSEWFSLPIALGMAAIAVVFGTLGDLCESMIKRQAGVKDSGNLIPGHGGILDRFDSVMFSVPFIFVYLLLI